MSCILLRSAQQAKNTELVVSLAVPITVFAFMVIVFLYVSSTVRLTLCHHISILRKYHSVALKLWSMRHPYQVRTQDGGTQIKTVKPEHVILQNIPSKTLASLEQSEELASKLQVRDAENW
ncbi:hypothetical protein BDV38DRAFT_244118 [Aspergillus pseudotamarii]|uniref:Uncharacterized protein n=1 Tax=Aspergillus pseudotamarii TaxID=132259 RepID=A0A5N6SXE2_ASPPS|nr:uncharacterized protein BDV38DRAFT_244118 [Aspergillus pseudotamarii]KAE8138577.1 hypothetical protein BDV38DRAFT_244118 [Aspergillus pseudotamarii]